MTSDNPQWELRVGYEIVFTVTYYYDGPRTGVANFLGRPHYYESIFEDLKQGYSDIYLLTPLTDPIFSAALEDWEIFRRWEAAFHRGETDRSSHPALPVDRSRHEQLEQILRNALKTDPERCIRKVGQFEALGSPELPNGVMRPLQVKWSEA